MRRKIINIGNSKGITIPPEVLNRIGAGVGSTAIVDVDPEERKIVLDFMVKDTVAPVDTEVYNVAKRLLNRYLPAFKKLANV